MQKPSGFRRRFNHISGANSLARVRLLLVALPGAGKGTQAAKLAVHYGIAHLSSGALLRTEVTKGTRIGRVAAAYLKRGDLVPGRTCLRDVGYAGSRGD